MNTRIMQHRGWLRRIEIKSSVTPQEQKRLNLCQHTLHQRQDFHIEQSCGASSKYVKRDWVGSTSCKSNYLFVPDWLLEKWGVLRVKCGMADEPEQVTQSAQWETLHHQDEVISGHYASSSLCFLITEDIIETSFKLRVFREYLNRLNVHISADYK